jgi:hypothetical protein
MSSDKPRDPRGSMIILDRGFDLIAPVTHDFFYESNTYEFRDVNDEGEVKIDGKTAHLNDSDDLWVRFRNKHIAEVLKILNEEVLSVVNESKKSAESKKSDEMTLEEMANIIRSMPKYEEMMKKY